jgi:uncharacterized membrane protein YfhO
VVARADYVLMGVPLPAGARSVELTFHSARYDTGKTVTLAGAALALLWLVLGVAQQRRRRAPAASA